MQVQGRRRPAGDVVEDPRDADDDLVFLFGDSISFVEWSLPVVECVFLGVDQGVEGMLGSRPRCCRHPCVPVSLG